jgi:DNA polymerase III subunit beta
MDLQVTQENLSHALNTVARVAGSRSTLPILSNVLIKIEDNRLSISATNLDIAINEYVGAKINKPGSLTVPARLMQDFVGNLPSGTIHIKQEDHKLHISADNYDSTINGIAADEFPVMPQIQNGKQWSIAANEFKKALQQVVFAASSDEARPVLTGVYIHCQDGNMYVAATDSYRLAEKLVGKNKEDISILVPATAIQDLLRVVGDKTENIDVTHDEQQVLFKVDNTELVARLIEGNYPDYQKLIPKNFAVEAKVAHDELINVVKVSSLFARETAGSVTAKVDEAEKTISIRSVASQVGENTATANANAKGEGDITLNSRYLLDGLQALNGKEVSVSFNGKLDPVVLKSTDENNYLHIVMPLKS